MVESDETIVIPGTTAVEGLNVTSATVTLTDGEPGSEDTATLSIAGPASSVDEGDSAVFVVTLSHQVDAAVTVAWSATLTRGRGESDYGPASARRCSRRTARRGRPLQSR